MILKIEIPEKFIEHFGNDKFKDSLGRICYDIENAFKTGSGVSGRYEWELVEMLADAFAKSEDYDHANERMERRIRRLTAALPSTATHNRGEVKMNGRELLDKSFRLSRDGLIFGEVIHKEHVESFLQENERKIKELEAENEKLKKEVADYHQLQWQHDALIDENEKLKLELIDITKNSNQTEMF